MAGLTMGIMILNRIPALEQPSSMAASSRSRGMPRMYWAMRKMKNPWPNTQGSVIETSVSDRPRCFRMMY